jgi:tRNA (guanine26-N2/guanine27-N2)-dimethyltransferase
VLDLMAGCGIRTLRYGQEAGAVTLWANDADPGRLPLLEENLTPLRGAGGPDLRLLTSTAQKLLAECLLQERRFTLVDLDAFGSPNALLPLALEAVRLDGVLYLASTDGRSPTGHDRVAAVRSLGAAARAHPASWELALRLQLGVVARTAWAMGRGILPLFSFSEGRAFRLAVRVLRRPLPGEEQGLGLMAYCHGCGDQQVQSLLKLRGWSPCPCATPSLAVSGPLWIGSLQHPPTLAGMRVQAGEVSIAAEATRLLTALASDEGCPARCWPTAEIGRRLRQGPPPLAPLLEALRGEGWRANASGVMAAQLRTDAPWEVVLQRAGALNR